MWEWLLWAGLITFFLLVSGSLFQFDFAIILIVATVGIGVMLWVRYEHQLARQRYLARSKSTRPEATIRTKPARRRRRR